MANEEHLDLIRRGTYEWNKWRRIHPSERPDLSEANLRGVILLAANLGGAIIDRADLRGVNLSNANLNKADLNRANLSGANLLGANLRVANLSGANLRDTDLRGANLRGANLRDTDLREAILLNADLDRANLSKADLGGANLLGANLFGADLKKADLNRANLNKADLNRANLSGANLSGANIVNATLGLSNLTDAIFPHATLISTTIDGAEMDRADLTSLITDSYTASKIPENISKAYRVSWTILGLAQEENSENIIKRSIEFESEYIDAGMSILSYFGTIIRQKYKDLPVSVTIKREGLKVSMTLETPDGMRETLEKTLTQYGLVITDKIPAENLLDNPIEVMQLQTQLNMAKFQLKEQDRYLQYIKREQGGRISSLEKHVEKLLTLLGEGLSSNKYSIETVRDISKQAMELISKLIESHKDIEGELLVLRDKLSIPDPDEHDIEAVKNNLRSIKKKEPGVFTQILDSLTSIGGNIAGSMWGSIIIKICEQLR